MGKTLMGGASQQGTVNLLNPQQQQYLSSVFGQESPYAQFTQPQTPEDLMQSFQYGVVNPALQLYNQQVVPSLQQKFVDANASSSSALNQALAQSAQDLTTSLGANFLNYQQGQQANQLNALGQLGNLATARTFEPIVQQQQGLLGPLIGSLGTLGAGYLSGGGSLLGPLLGLLGRGGR